MIIVTGIHRSGTTFLGSLLHQTGAYAYLHEPFNRDYGIKGVNCWYPYADIKSDSCSEVAVLLEKLHHLDIEFRIPCQKSDGFAKRLLRLFVHSRGHWDFLRFKFFSVHKEILIKDPFLSLCASWLVNRFSDVKVIYLVRHPVAVYGSLERMDWTFNLNEFYKQLDLSNVRLKDLSIQNFSCVDKCEVVATLWKVLYEIIKVQHSENPKDRSLIVRHEDLSSDPRNESERILKFLGIPMNNKVQQFIEKNMYSDQVHAKGKKLHDFRRSSAKLAYSWQEKKSIEHERIIKACSDTLGHYYPELV